MFQLLCSLSLLLRSQFTAFLGLLILSLISQCSAYQNERIVTDLEIIKSSEGVPVDFSYNETISSTFGYSTGEEDDLIISAPGCPKSIDGLPWVYVGNTSEYSRCYLASYPGPCEFSEKVMVETPGSSNGFCGCSCLMDGELENLEKSTNGRFVHCWSDLSVVYDSWCRRCYTFYLQGPCKPGELIIRLRNSTEVKCVPKYKGQCGHKFYNFETGECEEGGFGGGGGGGGFGGSVGAILPSDCSSNEKYSSVLKTCLKKKSRKSFVLG